MLLLIIPNIFNKITLKKILPRAMRRSTTSYNKIWVIDIVYSSFEEKRYGWTHIDKFTARHDMLYDEEYDLQSAKKYLFAKKHTILA